MKHFGLINVNLKLLPRVEFLNWLGSPENFVISKDFEYDRRSNTPELVTDPRNACLASDLGPCAVYTK